MNVTLFYNVALAAMLLAMVLLLWRAFQGPTVFDRIVAVNSFGTKTVLMIAVVVFMTDRPDFLDLSLVYAMMNFIGTMAVMRFTMIREFKAQDTES